MRRVAIALVLCLAASARAQSGILSSKHNLSVSGPGPVKALSETRVCIFCHVGHGQDVAGQNRPLPTAQHQGYQSSTLKSQVRSTPSGATRICLSCHDGTIAVGRTLASGTISMAGTGPGGALALGKSNLGTDLRTTHPVSFAPGLDPSQHPPSPGSPVRLDRSGELQCTACHDPHREDLDPVQKRFLVASNRYSALCTACHALTSWEANPAAHQSSTALFDPARGAPTAYGTVAENGCAACHRSHGGDDHGQLLRLDPSAPEDALCLSCHDGRVARTDLAADASKPSAHASRQTVRLHDAAEAPRDPRHPLPETQPSARRHASCVDCHDPHAAFDRPEAAPRAMGALAGVWGIDANGQPVRPAQFEYEVCFKCHADSANQPQARALPMPGEPRRAVPDVNLRRVFAPDAPSSHPLEGPGRAMDVPSLIPPLAPSSVIYCGDCHASDSGRGAGGQGPAGPHGSIYPHLLERNLSTDDLTPESPSSYALCYKCHSRDVLLSERSAFPLHKRHVVDGRAPCTACHDAHGVSAVSGNSLNNAHLIDFDLSIASPAKSGLLRYDSRGPRSGACTLSCHAKQHDGLAY